MKALAESKKHEAINLNEYNRARILVMSVLEEENSLRENLAQFQAVPLQKAEVFFSKEEHCTDCERPSKTFSN